MQRLLIGLVGCFLVVALVASTGLAFIYARVARTNSLRLAASQTQAMTDQTTIITLNYEIQALKKVIQGPAEGVDDIPLRSGSEVRRIIDVYKADMTAHASLLNADDRTYHHALNSLASTNNTKATEDTK